jgi:S1-C subfamily serine protease
MRFMKSLPDIIDLVRPSVVQVRVGADGMIPAPVGTGFIVDRSGLVLTARHVPRDGRKALEDQQRQNISFFIGLAQPNSANIRANFTLVGCEIVEEDPRHDLTLLRMIPNPFEGAVTSGIVIEGNPLPLLYEEATLSSDRPRDGSPIAVSGYPFGDPVLITTSGAVASAWAMDVQQVSPPGAPAGFTMPDIKDSYFADVSVNPGNSGGPVYSIDDGGIVGVCIAFRTAQVVTDKGPVAINGSPMYYNSGLSIVVPIRYGEELLARHVSSPRQTLPRPT